MCLERLHTVAYKRDYWFCELNTDHQIQIILCWASVKYILLSEWDFYNKCYFLKTFSLNKSAWGFFFKLLHFDIFPSSKTVISFSWWMIWWVSAIPGDASSSFKIPLKSWESWCCSFPHAWQLQCRIFSTSLSTLGMSSFPGHSSLTISHMDCAGMQESQCTRDSVDCGKVLGTL